MAVSNPAVAVLKPISNAVPVVFAMVADPVGSNFEPSMGAKWLEVLREAAPDTRQVMVLMHPETIAHREFWGAIEQKAPVMGSRRSRPACIRRTRSNAPLQPSPRADNAAA